ncbi:MAG: ATP-dependent Clp protease adaptor ClpS [Saprospiraceae bacterium]|nr:ATP-dependent Clp protease adaptor ClpS [Saprospiraceae bacterium]MBP7699717.1 ATP-dependent Clp protease adaptor ClpS [Saprospiraceae bacterium]
MNNFPSTHQQSDVLEAELDLLSDTGYASQIIVYNDDVNTFDWVIDCFMQILKHTCEQAEQLSVLIHYKGKASVKLGSVEKLIPYKDALVERGLSAVIETT